MNLIFNTFNILSKFILNQLKGNRFSNGNNGNSPLVAATYYFNPSSASVTANRPEGVYLSDGTSVNANNAINSASIEDDICTAPDGRKGTCYDASECVRKGGMPMGRCQAYSTNTKTFGAVCCLFDVTCGETAAEKFVYFRNPGFPEPYDRSRICRTKIGKISRDICQFRLDFRTFDIGKPLEGNCSQDIFTISGQNENHIVPKICGLNDGQHCKSHV